MKSKRTVALVLVFFTLAALITGCGSPAGPGGTPGGSSSTPGNSPISISPAKGRYTESSFDLELPQGVEALSVLGFGAADGAMEVFSMSANAWEMEAPTFYRHTITQDGTQTVQDEPWLNEHLKLGNEMRVIRGGDGALYVVYSDDASRARLIVSRDDGKTGVEITGGVGSLEMILGLGVLEDGRIAAKGWRQSVVTIFDSEGSRLTDIEAGGDSVAANGDYVAVLSPDGKGIRVHDMRADSYEDWPYQFDESGAQLAFSPDGTLYLADVTGIYCHAQGGTLWECIMDGASATIGLPNHYLTGVTVLGGERDTLYLMVNTMEGDKQFRYAFDPEASQTTEEQISVFSLYESDAVRRTIVAFNRIRSDVKVNYTVAMEMNGGGTVEDYIKALNTELLAGTGPDIILLDGMRVDSYIEKGVLADLTAIVDGADPILPNVRAAYEQGGELYCIPAALGVPLALSKSGSYENLAALETNAASLSKSAFTPGTLSEMLLYYYSEEFYSLPDESAAAALLAQVSRIADVLNVSANAEESQNEYFGSSFTQQLESYVLGESEVLLGEGYKAYGDNFTYFAGAFEQFGGEMKALNGKMAPLGLAGLNSASQYADTAAQFIQTLLSEDVQNGGSAQFGFPVNAAALDAILAFERDDIGGGMSLGKSETEFRFMWPSAVSREKLGSIIRSLNAPLNTDETLSSMLKPELTALFEGTETPESAAAKLFSKLSAYRSE